MFNGFTMDEKEAQRASEPSAKTCATRSVGVRLMPVLLLPLAAASKPWVAGFWAVLRPVDNPLVPRRPAVTGARDVLSTEAMPRS